jgi:hypothetical protein
VGGGGEERAAEQALLRPKKARLSSRSFDFVQVNDGIRPWDVVAVASHHYDLMLIEMAQDILSDLEAFLIKVDEGVIKEQRQANVSREVSRHRHAHCEVELILCPL